MARNSWSYRIVIIGGTGFRKTINCFTKFNNQSDIVKTIYLQKIHMKQSIRINKSKQTGLIYCKDLEAFLKYSNDKNDSYGNTDEYNPGKNLK